VEVNGPLVVKLLAAEEDGEGVLDADVHTCVDDKTSAVVVDRSRVDDAINIWVDAAASCIVAVDGVGVVACVVIAASVGVAACVGVVGVVACVAVAASVVDAACVVVVACVVVAAGDVVAARVLVAVCCVLVAGVVVSDVPVKVSSDAGCSSTRMAATEVELGLEEGARVVVEETRMLGSDVVVASTVVDADIAGARVATGVVGEVSGNTAEAVLLVATAAASSAVFEVPSVVAGVVEEVCGEVVDAELIVGTAASKAVVDADAEGASVVVANFAEEVCGEVVDAGLLVDTAASEVDSDIGVEGAFVASCTTASPNDVLGCASTDVDAGTCVEVTVVEVVWSGM